VVSNALNVSGLATLSASTVLNSFTVNGTTVSAVSATATFSALVVSNALNVSGLATLSASTIQNNFTVNGTTVSAVSATATFSALVVSNTISVGGLATISGISVVNTLSVGKITGLTSLNSIPLLFFNPSSLIVFGNTTNIGGTSNVGIGYQTLSGNTGGSVIAIGITAGQNNAGGNLVAIGSNAGQNNGGNSNVAIGDLAGSNQKGAGSNIAIGLRSMNNASGTLNIGIGYNAGSNASGGSSNCIYIGNGAGSNNLNSNSIFLGSNPGYNVSANTFVVYSTSASGPALQADLSNRWLGVGKPPAFALDVSGTIQVSNISAGQLAGYNLSLGSAQLNNVLTFDGTSIKWVAPAVVSSTTASWASFPAAQEVNLAEYNLSGLASFNNVPVFFKSVPQQICIGVSSLAGNTSVTVALGISAGISGGGGIYLGSNPGYYPTNANTFLVYSTNATRPFLQGNVSTICLGIGMAPGSNTLDVSGTIQGSNLLAPFAKIGQVTISSVNVGINNANPAHTLDVNGVINCQTISADSTRANTIGGVRLQNNIVSATTVSTGALSNVTSINTSPVNFSNSSVVLGSSYVSAGAASGNVTIGISSGTTSTVSNVVAIGNKAGESNSGSSNVFIGQGAGAQPSTRGGSQVNAIGISNSYGNLANYVDSIGFQAAFSNAATGSNLIAIGLNAGYSNVGESNIYIGAGAGIGTVVSNVSCAIVIGAGAGCLPALQGGNYSVGTRSVIIGNLARAIGTDSIAIGTVAIVNSNANKSIVIGSNASTRGSNCIAIGTSVFGGGESSANVIAIGISAGVSNSSVTNAIYLGSNPGYNPTSNNNFVLYSTNNTLPALQVDLANRYLGVGCVPAYPLDVAGQIRTTSNIINTINVTPVTVGSLTLNTGNYSTYFSFTYNAGTTVTVNLPGTTPLNGSYWVVKNNSTVNYTLSYNTGVLNFVGGPTTSYLQAGNGVTLIYSGANSVYYTF
jgi:hypothetical protein